jgi:hypothetical protein
LAYNGRRSRIKFWALLGAVIPFYTCQGQGVVLENKKRDSQKRLSLEVGTKKGKGTPTALEVPLPVIFSTLIVAAIYSKGKPALYQTE